MNQFTRITPPTPVARSDWRDSLTGCIRKDIQSKWRAAIHFDDESFETEFYLDADADEDAAVARARVIWWPAQRWPSHLIVTKLREATAYLVDDEYLAAHPLQSAALMAGGL